MILSAITMEMNLTKVDIAPLTTLTPDKLTVLTNPDAF